MRVAGVLELRVRHELGAGAGGVAFRVEPREAARRLLARHRLHLTPMPSGARLSRPIGRGAGPSMSLPRDGHLQFLICTDDPQFRLCTAAGAAGAREMIGYEARLTGGGKAAVRHSQAVARGPGDPARAVACLDVPVSLLPQDEGLEPVVLEARLPARSAHLRYYFIVPASAVPAAVTIEATRGASQTGGIEFPATMRVDHGVEDGSGDPVVTTLREGHPGRRVVSLTSSRAIPIRAAGGPRLAVMLGGSTALDPLPRPSLETLLAARAATKDRRLAPDLLFKVIDLSNHPAHDLGA